VTLHARKRFGQHFLEPAWADKVVQAIAPQPDDDFLEIGPGRGVLTRRLAARAAHVVAVEIDRDLAATLERQRPANLAVVTSDFLHLTPRDLLEALRSAGITGTVRVAGNLPYNVGAPILLRLRALAATGVPIADATLMLQREVAERLVAPPGGRDYGVLTVLMGYRSTVARLLDLPPGAFRPAPKVRSTLLRIRFRNPTPRAADEVLFERIVRTIFTRRRKTLVNALGGMPPGRLTPTRALARAGIDGTRRPETLSVAEFVGLADAYAAGAGSSLPGAPAAML
jgi:16S rRNA (adenine1518-N6/adenine1519-N6)-dimethyltransferase